MKIKHLIIIGFLFVCSIVNGQTKTDLLDKIDFNDTTLVGSEEFSREILDYIGACQDTTKSAQNQIYDVILAVDDVLSRCQVYEMYKFVYQYLIYGFSELGVNQVVDYMMRLPYIETLGLNDEELDEMRDLAESYSRVKIGVKAPEIQAYTIDKQDFKLESVSAEYTILMFWSANCPHCRDFISELGVYLSDKQNIAFVNVCVVGKQKVARRVIRRAKIDGYTICDGLEWSSPIVNDYAVDMTPSLFLLDENKVILAKPFDIEEIEQKIK